MNDAQKRGRRTLLLIALIFAVPIAGSMWLYFSGSSLNPVATTQNGELITPPRWLPEQPLRKDAEDNFREVWSLVVLSGTQCDEVCQQALIDIRQVRLSLGPKMTRMQTVLLPEAVNALPPEVAAEHPKLIIADPQATSEFRESFEPGQNGEVYMVDPFGNVMMRYATGTTMGDMRKDIAHLFKLSTIG